jgi:hypothetical protein
MTMIPQPLVSNGYTLSPAPERLGWLTSTEPHLLVKQLHDTYAQQGYIWFKGILDRAEILAFRRHYFAHFQACGLIAKGSDPVVGWYSGGPVDRARVSQLRNEVVRWPEYESLCKTPRLWQFYTASGDDGREDMGDTTERRMLRGGSWGSDADIARGLPQLRPHW